MSKKIKIVVFAYYDPTTLEGYPKSCDTVEKRASFDLACLQSGVYSFEEMLDWDEADPEVKLEIVELNDEGFEISNEEVFAEEDEVEDDEDVIIARIPDL